MASLKRTRPVAATLVLFTLAALVATGFLAIVATSITF
jgi:hypothetical protein